ncbi:MAG TPA: 5-oxoprolinase subunit PxpA [Limnobacter sp.]|nr:5-oxoprolinase subunit PxpA [Limnobacter sp.]
MINADLGEGCAHDEALFGMVDMANIACGGHAGDESSMREACLLALHHKVMAGAHPSYPDKAGFGRKRPELPPPDLQDALIEQVACFEAIARQVGLVTRHFKPHGQLYNDAAYNTELATMLIQVARAFPHLALVALAGSPQVALSRGLGVAVVEEAFPDRAYLPDGRLASRTTPGAVLCDPQHVYKQALAMLKGRPFPTLDGGRLRLHAHTLCVHGDSPAALQNARAVLMAVQGRRFSAY